MQFPYLCLLEKLLFTQSEYEYTVDICFTVLAHIYSLAAAPIHSMKTFLFNPPVVRCSALFPSGESKMMIHIHLPVCVINQAPELMSCIPTAGKQK